jgi:hypothetical protein
MNSICAWNAICRLPTATWLLAPASQHQCRASAVVRRRCARIRTARTLGQRSAALDCCSDPGLPRIADRIVAQSTHAI